MAPLPLSFSFDFPFLSTWLGLHWLGSPLLRTVWILYKCSLPSYLHFPEVIMNLSWLVDVIRQQFAFTYSVTSRSVLTSREQGRMHLWSIGPGPLSYLWEAVPKMSRLLIQALTVPLSLTQGIRAVILVVQTYSLFPSTLTKAGLPAINTTIDQQGELIGNEPNQAANTNGARQS